MITGLGALAFAWASLLAIVEVEALRRAVRGPAPVAPGGLAAKRVLIVRPCANRAGWLRASLTSLATARASFPFRCRLAVANADDLAFPVAREAVAELVRAGIDARVVLTRPDGPNRKAAQIARAVDAEASEYDVIIVADADVDLGGLDLDALVAPLFAGREVAAVWAPPVEAGAALTLGDRACRAVLSGSLHAFPLLARLDPGALVGKLFAVRREALEEVGGFGALGRHLGEDMELGRLLRAKGHHVEVASVPARSLCRGRAWAEVEERFARWILVIRAQRPLLLGAYPVVFFGTMPVATLAACTLAPALAIATAGGVVSLRIAIAIAAARAAGRRPSMEQARGWRAEITDALIDVILADSLLAVAFARALASRSVVWCDVALTVDRAGRLRFADPDLSSRRRA